MNPQTILTEVDQSMARLTEAAVIDQKRELLGNLYPLLKLTVEAVRDTQKNLFERMELMEDTLAEVIAGSESRIQPRLAKRIHAALSIGNDIVATLAGMHADQEKFKDFALPDELLMLMNAYQSAMMTAAGMVNDVTVEVIDEEDEEETPDGE